MNESQQTKWMLFSNLCKPFTISPLLMLLPQPPTRISLLLITTAACTNLSRLKREEARFSVLTSMLRSESTYLARVARRCKKSWCWILRTRPAADRFRWQRGSGSVSLEGRIKGWETLPGWGKGGMVQVGAVGKVSMVVASVDQPPDTMSPATGKLYEKTQ